MSIREICGFQYLLIGKCITGCSGVRFSDPAIKAVFDADVGYLYQAAQVNPVPDICCSYFFGFIVKIFFFLARAGESVYQIRNSVFFHRALFLFDIAKVRKSRDIKYFAKFVLVKFFGYGQENRTDPFGSFIDGMYRLDPVEGK